MVLLVVGLVLLTAFAPLIVARPPTSIASQHVLDVPYTSSHSEAPRKLHGRFLHITDIHPDPFYREGTDPEGEHPCHRGKGAAGYFGAEKTECDSPFSLVNATFDWIKQNIRDEIDFVIWTGDSARHDNDDEDYPRSNKQVEHLNEYIVTKFEQVFGKPRDNFVHDFVVPIVPTFGNNDILPHNILEPGPNRWTRKYLDIWSKFIPQEQRHSFTRGGWFFTEVIPDHLAVFSLNTLYFFDSNAAVDGCEDPNNPGYEHFEWLRIQLQFLRQRKMKAILTGHVPPARTGSKQNWDESCYQKYNLWLRQYRDVIVGNVFGHMNIDHVMLQDVRELSYKFKIPGIDDEGLRSEGSSISNQFHAAAKSEYLSDLREKWGSLPSPPKGLSYQAIDANITNYRNKKKNKQYKNFIREIGGPYGERFSLSYISPSVIPNFFPSLRIVEYNITGLKHAHPALSPTSPAFSDADLYGNLNAQEDRPYSQVHVEFEDNLRSSADLETNKKRKKKNKKKKKSKKPKPNFRLPNPPSKTAPPGPGYSPQTFTFVAIRQLFANLTTINAAVAEELAAQTLRGQNIRADSAPEELFEKHFEYELEYDTREDKMYKLKDLTMRSWLDVVEKIGRTKYNPLEEIEVDEEEIERTSVATDDLQDLVSITTVDEDEATDFSVEESHSVAASKKKHKKGKKRKGQSLKQNHLWRTFLKRAYVGAKSDDELEEEFG